MILRGGQPFFFPGGKHGVLLVHGFTATPAEMSLLGRFLHAKGYTVLGIRLAGHGTSPEDMMRMDQDDWYNSAVDGYTILSSCCEEVSVIGQSMGGLLSLRLAANAGSDISRVGVLASPIFIHEDRKLYRLPPREMCGKRCQHKKRREIANVPEECNISYGEMPLVSVHELLDLIELVKKELPRVKCPLLVIQSSNDHTVRTNSAEYIYRNAGSTQKELVWLEKSGHLLSIDCERDTVFAKVAEFLEVERL